MRSPGTLLGRGDHVHLAPHPPIQYEQALIEQVEQFRRRDRVHCVGCLTGKTHLTCRCKYVDKRGKLAGIGSPIYFLPGSSATPGNRCRVSIGDDRFVTRPCQYRIRELIPSPWNGSRPHMGVWIRCDIPTCTAQACFPYGLGGWSGAVEWVEVRRVAHLVSPYMASVKRRIRMLDVIRTSGQTKTDILACLCDLYGIGSLLNLRNSCKDLARECSMRVLTQVRNS